MRLKRRTERWWVDSQCRRWSHWRWHWHEDEAEAAEEALRRWLDRDAVHGRNRHLPTQQSHA